MGSHSVCWKAKVKAKAAAKTSAGAKAGASARDHSAGTPKRLICFFGWFYRQKTSKKSIRFKTLQSHPESIPKNIQKTSQKTLQKTLNKKPIQKKHSKNNTPKKAPPPLALHGLHLTAWEEMRCWSARHSGCVIGAKRRIRPLTRRRGHGSGYGRRKYLVFFEMLHFFKIKT